MSAQLGGVVPSHERSRPVPNWRRSAVLAELHGKFDPERVLALDRSEDLLTSAVSGAIRHAPRSAVSALSRRPSGLAAELRTARIELSP